MDPGVVSRCYAQNIKNSWDREGNSLSDTTGEVQCDAVKFSVVHAWHNQSQSISNRPCRLAYYCSLVTQSLRDRPAKQVGNRPAPNSPLVWSSPLSRKRIQTPLAKPRWCINARGLRFAAVSQYKNTRGLPKLRFTQAPGSSFQIPHRLDFRDPRGGWQTPKARLPHETPFSSEGKTLAKRDNAFMRGCVNTTTKL